MNTSLIARGGVPVQLDRERIVFFNMHGTGFLYRKYGQTFWRELYIPVENADGTPGVPLIRDIEVLGYFLWAGLQADAQNHGETLTLDQVANMIFPLTVQPIANVISQALTFDFIAPAPGGKAEAVAASPADAASIGPGRQKDSTMPKRRDSLSAPSAGRPASSSKRRSRR